MSEKKILVFIPIFNCEKQIIRVLTQFDHKIAPFISHIIVVNNLSIDNSETAIINYLEKNDFPCNISLLRNKENYSLGGSHKVAFNYAIENSFDYVIVLHGDDQGNINDILPYIKDLTIEKYDSLLGSRFEKKSKLQNYSRFRIFGNYILNTFISLLVFHKITDLGSGLNIYRTEYLKNKFYLYFPNNLTFNVYILLYGLFSNSKFGFFPLTWREEDQVSNAKLFAQTKEILGLVFRFTFNAKKLFSRERNKYSIMNYESKIIYSKNI